MVREGQTKVEVRPGVFLWLNEADRKAFEARQASPQANLIASATLAPPETAVIDTPKARKPR